MEISQIALGKLSFVALILGIALGCVYDFINCIADASYANCSIGVGSHFQAIRRFYIFPKKKEHPRTKAVLRFFTDFFFCIFAAISIILLFYQGNNGKMRLSVLVCMLLGVLLYRSLLSRMVLACFGACFAFFAGTVRLIGFVAMFPLLWVLKKAAFGVLCGWNAFSARRARKQRLRYTAALMRLMEENGVGMITEEKTKRNRHGKSKKKTV